MLETVIANAIKKYDEEVSDIKINGDKVVITYTDGDKYTGNVRVEDDALVLNFRDIYILRVTFIVNV